MNSRHLRSTKPSNGGSKIPPLPELSTVAETLPSVQGMID